MTEDIDSIDVEDCEVVVDVEVDGSEGDHYRLLRVRGEGELVFARRWEEYNEEGDLESDNDWELVRGDEQISVEAVIGFSSK